MANQIHNQTAAPVPIAGSMPNNVGIQMRRFVMAVAALTICFVIPLWKLFHFAASSDLFSYILLIPFISLYLVWLRRGRVRLCSRPSRMLAGSFLSVGMAVIVLYWLWLRSRLPNVTEDYLMTMTVCFVFFLYGISALFWGGETMRAVAFPLAFLLLLTPIPPVCIQKMDSFLQWGSALAASAFFSLSGAPFLDDGLAFRLPNINLAIAPECSGIHSTVVLFITSLLSGYIFLKTPWKRVLLVLFVLPLGLLRNGFRVFVIGELCIHLGPQMINSPIHRKGGPLFFVLSLIPLFSILYLLRRSEK